MKIYTSREAMPLHVRQKTRLSSMALVLSALTMEGAQIGLVIK
jgi:hypothetical protein